MHEDGWPRPLSRRCRRVRQRERGAGAVGGRAKEEQAKPVRVAVIMASLGNDYIAQKEGAEEAASSLDGADVTVSAGRARGRRTTSSA